jgi:hypothetical protein
MKRADLLSGIFDRSTKKADVAKSTQRVQGRVGLLID